MAPERVDVPRRILTEMRGITVVGCSATPGKYAHDVPLMMRRRGYAIVPVNPNREAWEGQPVFKRLADAPRPELVDVFRPAAEAPDVARQAVACGARALWLQQGIRSPEARRIAEEAGLLYVEDKCVNSEWNRLRYAGVQAPRLGEPS